MVANIGIPFDQYFTSVSDQQSLYPDEQHTVAFYVNYVPSVGLQTGVNMRKA